MSEISRRRILDVLDDVLDGEQVDLAGLLVEARLQVLVRLVVLARRRQDGVFDGSDDRVGLDAFFLGQRLDRLHQRVLQVQNSTSNRPRVINAMRQAVHTSLGSSSRTAVSVDPAKPSLERLLVVHGLADDDLREPAGEPPVVVRAAQRPIESRRRNLERVREGQRVLHVEDGADLAAHLLAILDADAFLGVAAGPAGR